MNGRKPKLTPDQVRALREWAAFGKNMSEVGARLGINRRTVGAYLRREHKRREFA
jgi:DNA-binding CsgD family transcriptional regulator